MPQTFFHAGHFGGKRAGVAFAIVELRRNADAVAVDGQGFDALLEQIEQRPDVSLDHRAHGVQPIIEAALVDQIDGASDVLAHALARAQRRDAEFK